MVSIIEQVQAMDSLYMTEAIDTNLIVSWRDLLEKKFPQGVAETLMDITIEERINRVTDFSEKVFKLMDVDIAELRIQMIEHVQTYGFINTKVKLDEKLEDESDIQLQSLIIK